MAKAKFSALISELRGKLNGSKFSRAIGGATLLNKVTPINRRTNIQIAKRAEITVLSQAWKSLTDSQRNGWEALAKETPLKNIFGDTYFMSGFDCFVCVNVNNKQIGGATMYVNAPYIVYPVVADIANMVADSTPTPLLTFDKPLVGTGDILVLFATPQISPGKSNLNGLYKPLKTFTAGAAAPATDVITEYTAKYGSLRAGAKISIYGRWYTTTGTIKPVHGNVLNTIVL